MDEVLRGLLGELCFAAYGDREYQSSTPNAVGQPVAIDSPGGAVVAAIEDIEDYFTSLRFDLNAANERAWELEAAWREAREAVMVYCIEENYHTRAKDIMSGTVFARRATVEMYGPQRARECVRIMDAALAGGGKEGDHA